MFKSNVGLVDRTVRILAGMVMLVAIAIFPHWPWRYVLLVGAISLVTGLLGTCPIYSLLGISSEIKRSEDMN